MNLRVLLLVVCCVFSNACAVARRAMQAEDARVRPEFLTESAARRSLDARTTLLTDSASWKGNRLLLGGYGTATPIDARGYYLTCAHCLHGRPLLLFRADEGRVTDAGSVQVLWKDKSSDLALLYSPCRPPEVCRPGNVGPGEGVMAMDPTRRHTLGRVTRVTRAHILHTADIPPGCSGGGLFNERLELVGLNSCVVYRGIWPVFWKRTDSRAVRLGDGQWAAIRERVAAHRDAGGDRAAGVDGGIWFPAASLSTGSAATSVSLTTPPSTTRPPPRKRWFRPTSSARGAARTGGQGPSGRPF